MLSAADATKLGCKMPIHKEVKESDTRGGGGLKKSLPQETVANKLFWKEEKQESRTFSFMWQLFIAINLQHHRFIFCHI